MNVCQRRILDHVAAFAARFDCVAAIYIFGSIARGETAEADDIDLAVDFLPLDRIAAECAVSYGEFQVAFGPWALASRDLFSRPLRFSRAYLGETGAEWGAVLAAASRPVASAGKAIMAATPRHAPKLRS